MSDLRDQIDKYIEAEPYIPFSVTMNSGKTYKVEPPTIPAYGEEYLLLVTHPRGDALVTHLPFRNISSVDTLPVDPPEVIEALAALREQLRALKMKKPFEAFKVITKDTQEYLVNAENCIAVNDANLLLFPSSKSSASMIRIKLRNIRDVVMVGTVGAP